MTNWLPPTELTIQKRCERSKPWAIGLLAGLFSPVIASLVFSYRQRKWDYIFYFIVTFSLIFGIRSVFPTPPVKGTYIIPFLNWIVYSSYGPQLIHGLIQFFIAKELKQGRSMLPNNNWEPSDSTAFDEGFRKSQVKDLKPFEATNDISREKLKELKVCINMDLIKSLLSQVSLFFSTFYIFVIFGSFLKGGEISTDSGVSSFIIVLVFYFLSLSWVDRDKKRLIPFPPKGDLNISISIFAAMFGIYRGMTLSLF
tara:strand:+ start:2221 stop:2985 length:765 start_codon:yes stop_codon:yes gene_type:complete